MVPPASHPGGYFFARGRLSDFSESRFQKRGGSCILVKDKVLSGKRYREGADWGSSQKNGAVKWRTFEIGSLARSLNDRPLWIVFILHVLMFWVGEEIGNAMTKE